MLIDLSFTSWLVRIMKFGVVGSFGLVVDFGVTYLCKEKLKWNKFFANSLGFSFSVIQNYYLNRTWTFNNSDQHFGVQFSKFLFVAITGLLLNNIILYFLLKKTGGRYFYVCKACVVAIVFIWNFSANAFYTFK